MAATEKVSLTLGHDEIHLARMMAERTGLSLSAIVNAAVQRHLSALVAEIERRRAAEEIIATFSKDALPTADRLRQISALWSLAKQPTEIQVRRVLGRRARKRPKRIAPART